MNSNVKACMLIVLFLSLSLYGLAWADESDLVWSTFFGGSNHDYGVSVAVDSLCNAYLTGWTESIDFPITVGSYDTSHNTNEDAYIAKLNPTGSGLIYSTFIGGGGDDVGWSIVVDGSGSAYVIGKTDSYDFPTTPEAFDITFNGEKDVFVVKLLPDGDSLDYATFIGGYGYDRGWGIALDCSCNAYVTGYTSSTTFPTTYSAYDTIHNGIEDAFVAKLNSSGSEMKYSTFLGGGDYDQGHGIAVDNNGCVYASGYTSSDDFPTTDGAYDNSHNGEQDAYVIKLNPQGSDLEFATYLGGSGEDRGYGIALDSDHNVYLTGFTLSPDFPRTPEAFDSTYNGGDAFVVKLNAIGNALEYATFLGGSNYEEGHGLSVDDAGNAHVTGFTESSDFPTTTEAFDTTFNGGGTDAFIARFDPTGNTISYATFLGGSGSEETHSVPLDKMGKVYVTGYTDSPDFPTTFGSFDTTHNGYADVIVAKLDMSLPASGLIVARMDTIDNISVYAVEWISQGNVFETNFYFEQGDYIRYYAVTHPGEDTVFIPGIRYIVKTNDLHIGDTWLAWEGKATIAEVISITEYVTTPAGVFLSSKITYSDTLTGEIKRVSYYSEDIGLVKKEFHDLSFTIILTGSLILGGSGYFPLYLGNFWEYDIETNVFEDHLTEIPQIFVLYQNYPNPFNTSTEIRYQIPSENHVSLRIFNTLGQEVRTLVNADQEAGDYAAVWDGRDALGREVASGFYFCRLKSGNFNKTIKMILIR